MLYNWDERRADKLIVSCDGFTQETYERYRLGSLGVLLANQGLDQRSTLEAAFLRAIMQFIVFRHNEHQMEEFKSFWEKVGVDGQRVIGGHACARAFPEKAKRY